VASTSSESHVGVVGQLAEERFDVSLGPSRRSRRVRNDALRADWRDEEGKPTNLCVERPSTTNKQGRTTVRYPRGAEAEKQLHAAAVDALKRARTPEAALAVVLRLLVAQRLADTAGLANADRQGIYEPRELATSNVLGKLAARVAPTSVKERRAEQEAEQERSGGGPHDEPTARPQDEGEATE
jgi:hypothetical protein